MKIQDEELNSLTYGTLLYINTYGSYKLWKNSPVFLAQHVHGKYKYSS